jgi:hypothetical protein
VRRLRVARLQGPLGVFAAVERPLPLSLAPSPSLTFAPVEPARHVADQLVGLVARVRAAPFVLHGQGQRCPLRHHQAHALLKHWSRRGWDEARADDGAAAQVHPPLSRVWSLSLPFVRAGSRFSVSSPGVDAVCVARWQGAIGIERVEGARGRESPPPPTSPLLSPLRGELVARCFRNRGVRRSKAGIDSMWS